MLSLRDAFGPRVALLRDLEASRSRASGAPSSDPTCMLYRPQGRDMLCLLGVLGYGSFGCSKGCFKIVAASLLLIISGLVAFGLPSRTHVSLHARILGRFCVEALQGRG